MTTAVAAAPIQAAPARGRWTGPWLGLLIVSAAVAGVALAVGPGGRSPGALLQDNVLTNAVNGVEIGLIAGVLLWLRPGNRVGFLLLFIAAVNALAIFGEGWALASYQLGLPGRTAMAWLASWVWSTSLILGATVLPAIYPGGRAVSRFARRVTACGWTVSLVLGACLALLDSTYRSSAPGHRLGHNPISDGSFQTPIIAVAIAAGLAGVVLVLVSTGWLLVRLWRSVSPEREQLAWLLAAVLPAIAAGLLAPPVVLFVVTLLTSVALVIGIVRHQLFDIKLVVRSGLVYGSLISLAVGAYFAVVALITLLTPSGTIPSLFAAAAVALLVRPAYSHLARRAGRLVYGDRDDPVAAFHRVGTGLAHDSGTAPGLEGMLAAVALSVRSPYVCVRAPSGAVLAATGSLSGQTVHEVPLRYAGVDLGALVVAGRSGAAGLPAADRRLLDALAGPVAASVRAAQLADEVERSRARVLAVRETERRSLRNDLHDGLGPSLSGVALGIEAALHAGDEERVREILGVVHGEVTGLVTEVRHLIDDLGPAGLEPGGLVTALRAHAQAVSALGQLDVRVDAAELPALPVPVEVALHRIATEAVTNVVRHAGARRATVSLDVLPAWVRLTVVDDGCGLGDASAGIGRTSMRERAASVGGTLTVDQPSGRGTRVVAEVPRWEAR
ncbi:MAG TPA: ATP-binding protein [Nocardioidaceae bacterium]|nr:ATP-binding protein [Nocardioidaceae bacterium]